MPAAFAFCRCLSLGHGSVSHRLVYLPTGRLLATFGTIREARALAAELAAVWVRWEGKEEPGQ